MKTTERVVFDEIGSMTQKYGTSIELYDGVVSHKITFVEGNLNRYRVIVVEVKDE